MNEVVGVVGVAGSYINQGHRQLTINIPSQIRSRIAIEIRHDYRHTATANDLVAETLESTVAVSQQDLKSAS